MSNKKQTISAVVFVTICLLIFYFRHHVVGYSVYFYKKVMTEEFVLIGDCKLSVFNGWVVKSKKIDKASFLNFPIDNRMQFFSIYGKEEIDHECDHVLINDFKICGIERAREDGNLDSVYFFKDEKIKVIIGNHSFNGNEFVSYLTENFACSKKQ